MIPNARSICYERLATRLRRVSDGILPWHEYLGGTARGLGAFPQEIGGIEDHVHLLIGLKSTHCIADFMRELKKSASAWVHETIGMKDFAWQEGYGIFSVSAPAADGGRQEHRQARSTSDRFHSPQWRPASPKHSRFSDFRSRPIR